MEEVLPAWRRWLFRLGVAGAAVASILTVLSWLAPFPLRHDAGGGYTDVNSIVGLRSVIVSILPLVLAPFGRGISRILLLVCGAVCFLAAYGGLLANGH